MRNRVLIYCHSLSGGAGRNAKLYANIINDHVCPVDIVCSYAESKLVDDLHSGVVVHITKSPRNLYNIPILAVLLRKIRPRIILCIGEGNAIAGNIARALSFTGASVVIRDTQDHISWLRQMKVFERCIRSVFAADAFKRARKIISLCPSMMERSSKLWGLDTSKYVIIPNGVSTNARVTQNCNEHGKADIYTYLYVGRLERQKSVDTLLRAFRIVESVNEKSRLLIVGTGALRSEYQQLAASLDLNNVKWLGYKRNLSSIYRQGDCFVLPSIYEGFPNVLIESMSYGLNIVSTDCPTGPSYILRGGKDGILVKCKDPDMMASAMLNVRKNPFQSEQIRRRAADFSREALAARVISLFNSLID